MTTQQNINPNKMKGIQFFRGIRIELLLKNCMQYTSDTIAPKTNKILRRAMVPLTAQIPNRMLEIPINIHPNASIFPLEKKGLDLDSLNPGEFIIQ